ncbi:unnamed protein product [Adineta ricciae]|uniref:Uncharacterized protein n=2 Tax=Adineta ricciae TaxID=249248 RepID=A0A815M559_ADIRI|nr:unnamed protein product [Adineta ricciae]
MQNSEDDYRTILFYLIFDSILLKLNDRFSDDNTLILNGISVLFPESNNFLHIESIQPLGTQTNVDFSALCNKIHALKPVLKDKTMDNVGEVSTIFEYNLPMFVLERVPTDPISVPSRTRRALSNGVTEFVEFYSEPCLERLERIPERIWEAFTRIWCQHFIKKMKYFVIFLTIVWTMENLTTPLDRARRVLLGTLIGSVGTRSKTNMGRLYSNMVLTSPTSMDNIVDLYTELLPLKPTFPELTVLLLVAITIPIPSTMCERIFN